MRSPKSWVTQLEVGRLAAAGAGARRTRTAARRTCEPLTVSGRQGARSSSGGIERRSRSARARARGGRPPGAMFDGLVLDLALALGRADVCTHTPQPVQSSGATWMVEPVVRAGPASRKSLARKPSGAPARPRAAYTFMRMAAWGHTRAHLPQSMQSVGSQIGISAASARFSYRAVPVGKVPSTGRALTGSRSPSPASIRAVTRWTKSGASSGDRRAPRHVAVDRGGHRTAVQRAERARRRRRSCARRRRGPRFAVGPSRSRPWMAAMASLGRQHAGEREEAGLHHGVDAAAHARLAGHAVGVDHAEAEALVDDLPAAPRPAGGPTPRRARSGLLSRKWPRRGPVPSTSSRSSKPNWWQADEVGAVDQVGGADRLGAEAQVRHGHRPRLLRSRRRSSPGRAGRCARR